MALAVPTVGTFTLTPTSLQMRLGSPADRFVITLHAKGQLRLRVPQTHTASPAEKRIAFQSVRTMKDNWSCRMDMRAACRRQIPIPVGSNIFRGRRPTPGHQSTLCRRHHSLRTASIDPTECAASISWMIAIATINFTNLFGFISTRWRTRTERRPPS